MFRIMFRIQSLLSFTILGLWAANLSAEEVDFGSIGFRLPEAWVVEDPRAEAPAHLLASWRGGGSFQSLRLTLARSQMGSLTALDPESVADSLRRQMPGSTVLEIDWLDQRSSSVLRARMKISGDGSEQLLFITESYYQHVLAFSGPADELESCSAELDRIARSIVIRSAGMFDQKAVFWLWACMLGGTVGAGVSRGSARSRWLP